MRPSEGHSRTADHIVRDKLRHGKSGQSEWHSLPGDRIGRDKSGHRNNETEQGSLTSWRPHREGQVRIGKEFDRVSEWHSQPGDHTVMGKLGHRKNAIE